MSGEADGLILLPLAAAALPLVLGGLAVAGIAAVAIKAGSAAVNYEKNQRQIRNEIKDSGIKNSIGEFRSQMKAAMDEQTRLNIKTSEQMMRELDKQRREMQSAAEQHDIQAYSSFTAQLKNSHSRTVQTISKAQESFNASYRQSIAKSMDNIYDSVSRKYSSYLSELQGLKSDANTRKARAQEIASSYIDEAKSLIESLVNDFSGKKFSARELDTLQQQLNKACEMYNNGRYESAIASAKDTAMNILEEIYEADARKQEWDNYYKLALVLSEEVKTFTESQEVITPDIKAYVEKASGKPLEEDIVGIRISDYTERDEKGYNRFDTLKNKIIEVHEKLHSVDADKLSTGELKDCISLLNNQLYPDIAECISKAITNMNNAFSRQNMSEELIDFFEEHNFIFSGYAYDDDRHDKALHMGFENESTGEELLITLSPELMQNGDIQTHVDLKQTKGDEANEERKAYYRHCIEQVVTESNPYASVNLKCKAETKGKLSSDTQIKKKLKNQ